MFSLPEKYKKDAPIAKVTFIRGAQLTGAEKKRFETTVEQIRLMYQIEGFEIPNLVNDDYNCQVIMFLRITLKDLKQSAFIAKIVQKCIAPLCVLELTDGISSQYSFADKRLNRQNEKEFVIESEYLTEKLPLNHQNDRRTIFSLYIDYETILALINDVSQYLTKVGIQMGMDENVTYNISGNQVNFAKDNANINAVQNNNGMNADELKNLISAMRRELSEELSDEDKNDANESINIIEAELASGQPDEEKVKSNFKLLKRIDGTVKFASACCSLLTFADKVYPFINQIIPWFQSLI